MTKGESDDAESLSGDSDFSNGDLDLPSSTDTSAQETTTLERPAASVKQVVSQPVGGTGARVQTGGKVARVKQAGGKGARVKQVGESVGGKPLGVSGWGQTGRGKRPPADGTDSDSILVSS